MTASSSFLRPMHWSEMGASRYTSGSSARQHQPSFRPKEAESERTKIVDHLVRRRTKLVRCDLDVHGGVNSGDRKDGGRIIGEVGESRVVEVPAPA